MEPSTASTGSSPAVASGEADALKAACRATWEAYSRAYQSRYGCAPVRNGKVNAHVVQLVRRLGFEESPQVAAWFVSVNESFAVRATHDIGILLQRAESYRTQWFAGRAMTSTRAAQIDQSQSNMNVADEAKELLRGYGHAV